MKKKIVWAVLIVIAIIIAIAIFGSYVPAIDRAIEGVRARAMMDKYEKDKAAREAALRADTTGGKTPEETVRLFVAALRQKDAPSASKFYTIETQAKALETLQKELAERGDLQRTIDYFGEVVKRGKKVCEENRIESGCGFVYTYVTTKDETVKISNYNGSVFVPAGSSQESGIQFILNKITDKWKIKK